MRSSAFAAFALTLFVLLNVCTSYPQQGKFLLHVNSSHPYEGVAKNVFKDTKIIITVNCLSNDHQKVRIGWILRETCCWNEFAFYEQQGHIFENYYQQPGTILPGFSDCNPNSTVRFVKSQEEEYQCNGLFPLSALEPTTEPGTGVARSNVSNEKTETVNGDAGPKVNVVNYVVNEDGDYLFAIMVKKEDQNTQDFEANIKVEFKNDAGYLSIVDWPLLPFYGVMCGIYLCMGIGWLVVCSMHFTELLRIQFYIGGVIFMGMLEKAMFYAEFQSINSTGSSTKGLIFAAELVSCAKRTMARMLVIIVSVGFGIVKPRLGPTLHRVVGVGGLYFVLSITEAYLRVTKPKNDVSTGTMLAGVPLAVIDSAICWWVFTALTTTLRTLRLRRNLVKFTLYRHFTNVLIFSVIASVVFMLINIKLFKLEQCLKDWRELWVDEAFWHFQFSILLACIMLLWTPSNNNKRYAFQPLLDNDEDDSDDEDFNALLPDAYEGMKHRMTVLANGGKSKDAAADDDGANAEDDPLRWVEENIPATADNENPLPVLDTEEEIETTRFELSKMQ